MSERVPCRAQDTCPTCLEKVDLRSVFADRPWETRNLTWWGGGSMQRKTP